MPSTEYRSVAQAIAVEDEEGVPQKLVRFSDLQPSQRNRDPFRITLNTQWLLEQSCPEHPEARCWIARSNGLAVQRGFRGVRTKWKRMPWNTRLWGVAVQFICPHNEHVWETYIRPN